MRATTAPSRARSCARPSSRSREADLVVFLVDAKTAPGAADLELADRLRRSHVPVLLVANKLDDPSRHDEALEYHALGLGEPFALSALHGIAHRRPAGRDLLAPAGARDARAPSAWPTRSASSSSDGPNVGKSSLLNALLDEQRAIVSEIPGHDARLDRHPPGARRSRLPPDRHRRSAASPRAAPAGRVLERGALARGRSPGRRRARAGRRHRGHHRAGPARGRRRPPRELRHRVRALEVGHRAAGARGRARAAAHQGAPAPADRGHLGAHQARPRAPRARDRRHLRPLRQPHRHGRVQPPAARHPGDARGAARARAGGSRSTTARRCSRGRRASG